MQLKFKVDRPVRVTSDLGLGGTSVAFCKAPPLLVGARSSLPQCPLLRSHTWLLCDPYHSYLFLWVLALQSHGWLFHNPMLKHWWESIHNVFHFPEKTMLKTRASKTGVMSCPFSRKNILSAPEKTNPNWKILTSTSSCKLSLLKRSLAAKSFFFSVWNYRWNESTQLKTVFGTLRLLRKWASHCPLN